MDAIAGGALTVADLRIGLAATHALVSAAFSVSPVLGAPRQLPVPETPPDAAALLSDELSALFGDILDKPVTATLQDGVSHAGLLIGGLQPFG